MAESWANWPPFFLARQAGKQRRPGAGRKKQLTAKAAQSPARLTRTEPQLPPLPGQRINVILNIIFAYFSLANVPAERKDLRAAAHVNASWPDCFFPRRTSCRLQLYNFGQAASVGSCHLARHCEGCPEECID